MAKCANQPCNLCEVGGSSVWELGFVEMQIFAVGAGLIIVVQGYIGNTTKLKASNRSLKHQ